ncbi:antitoxin, partial [Pseudomonas sp. RIT778]|nr:antitoxin [Pseudomonas sp. RIT778]
MAVAPKPKTADGYSSDHTNACEQVLVTLLGAFGTLKATIRLVGGLVPRYLTPEAPPNIPPHAGTSDVDVVLNLQVIAEGGGYASLAQQLAERGFERFTEDNGWASAWRWQRRISDRHVVLVEFLRGAIEQKPFSTISIDGEEVSALAIEHAEITHDWFEEKRVTATLLDGKGIAIEDVRYADLVAFII